MADPREAASDAWKRPQELPDGRVVEYLWTVPDDCDVPPPAGHLRVLVHLLIDGEVAIVPVLLTPDHIAQATQAEASGQAGEPS